MMNGKQKLYFLLDRIDDARTIAPSGQSLKIDPTNDLNRNYSDNELLNLFAKLEKDEKVIKVLQIPSRLQVVIVIDDPFVPQPKPEHNDGYFHIEVLPTFDNYFLKIQEESGYQEFTGKIPTRHKVPATYDLSTALRPEIYKKVQSKNTDSEASRKDKPRTKDTSEKKVNHNVNRVLLITTMTSFISHSGNNSLMLMHA